MNRLASQATFWPFDSWGDAPKPWRRAARRSIAPVSVWCAGEVEGAAAGAPARTVLGRSRGSFAFQSPETWRAPRLSAERIPVSRSSVLKGLLRKQTAPALSARSRTRLSGNAVITMTGIR